MAPAQEDVRDSGVVTMREGEEEEDSWEGRTPPPEWLDAAFLQEALAKEGSACGTSQPIVEHIEVRYATAKGDNYCSLLFRVRARVRVRGQSTGRCVLVKCLPAGDAFRHLVEHQGFFQTEAHVLSQVVPAMEALLQAAAPGRYPPLAARCLRHGAHPGRHLVLQDLLPEGFALAPRLRGLDAATARVTLRALGRFHGASAALRRRRPHLFAPLRSPFDAQADGDADAALRAEDFLGAAARAVSSWGAPFRPYRHKILSLQGKLLKKVQEIARERPGRFNVLIHGDFWINNMLFRYDAAGRACDVRFVDLQMSHVTNPAIDLLLLRFTSLEEDVFWKRWDWLLEEYAASLAHTLQLLGEEPVTLEDVHRDLEEAKHFAIMAAFLWMPPVKLQGAQYDIDQALKEGFDSQAAMYNTPVFRHWMERLLPLFDQEGLFDL